MPHNVTCNGTHGDWYVTHGDTVNHFTCFSQGENWHRLRTVTAPKMLKMKEALDFCGAMNDVGEDFIKHLAEARHGNDEVHGLEKELFKWAFECEWTLTQLRHVRIKT